jgi:hypothetical protein
MKCPECLGPVDNCPNPKEMKGLGMYHCPVCGVMQVAGTPHINCFRCGGTGEIKEGEE